MRKIQDQPSLFFRFFSSKIVLLVWIFGCLLIGIRLLYSALETREAFSAKKQAEDQLKLEEEKGLKLLEKLKNAETSLEQERRIRDELNMQKPGEIILQLPSPTP